MSVPPLVQVRKAQEQALKDLIAYAGSNVHLAKMTNLPVSTVNSWVSRGRISKKGAELIQENAYLREQFPFEKLRPETNY